MQIPDLINGLYESLGAFFILNHIRALWKSKQAHGISLLSVVFFTTWGFWNLFYYPHLNQWWSFAGGVAIVLMNLGWIGLIWWLRRLPK
jgi:uncharacterized membrane protein YfcA